jgi:glycosyltransferase involved in cell wall biosynthesis
VKFALITPRYGAEIAHGPEHVCRLLAEQLAERHDVDALTTCARDAETWKNEYPEGADRVRGVLVRRFAASGGREPEAFRALGERLRTSPHGRGDELEWVRRSGTSSQGLVDFLKRQHRSYDALVFFSAAAGTTIHGLGVAPERSILFPCTTVEPSLRLYICQETLGAASAMAYCSAAERRIVRAYARRLPRHEEFVGVGVESTPELRYPRLQQDAVEPEEDADDALPVESDAPLPHLTGRGVLFRRRHRLHGPYVLYGGPVEADNGAEELIEYFAGYAAEDGEAQAALVLMGVKMMKVPAEPWLRPAGVLAERDRMAALEAADVTVAPDPNDVAGGHVLESLAAGTPVLASARSFAAAEHCRRSNGGLWYSNGEEFAAALRLLMTDDRLRAALGRNGRRYVQQHHRWDAVLARFERLVAKLRSTRA